MFVHTGDRPHTVLNLFPPSYCWQGKVTFKKKCNCFYRLALEKGDLQAVFVGIEGTLVSADW